MFTKFSPGLFLEKVELERFRKSLDEKGFRLLLLNNTLKFGLIDKQYFNTSRVAVNPFNNGKVYESAGLSIAHNELNAIDKNGNFIYKAATTNISVPGDSNWYWVKVKHQYTSKELGVFSIDAQGNLTGDSVSELLMILRGQPYFPSRVKFTNSVSNTLEYDVLEVIDDSHAILQGYFIAESNLSLSIVGTFAPGTISTSDDKEKFQYDDCVFTLIQEVTVNTAPAKLEGEEFYLARVKSDNIELTIQDKRTEKWETKSDFFLQDIEKSTNPLLGIERVRYDHSFSTKDYNILDIAWGMRSENWSVNTKLNQVTFSSGQGGRYKDVTYFNDGDFDGWRLYWQDGSFSNIISSIKNGNQINLTLDRLDIDKVSDNGGVTFNSGTLIAAPNAEEIEITLTPYINGGGEPEPITQTYVFPINTEKGLCRALVFSDPSCEYEIAYRYKRESSYSAIITMTADNQFGYYTEKAFDADGYILPVVQSQSHALNLSQGYIALYSSNIIVLTLKDDAYVKQIQKIDLGDILGVDVKSITTGINDIILTPGVDRVYQYFNAAPTTLNDNKRIILADGLVNGNTFLLHFKQPVSLSNYTLRITNSTFNVLKDITSSVSYLINNASEGLYIRCTWNGVEWILNNTSEYVSVNDVIDLSWQALIGVVNGTYYLTDTVGGHSITDTWLPAADYDRIITIHSVLTSGPNISTYGIMESFIGSNTESLFGRITDNGVMTIILPAKVRYKIKLDLATSQAQVFVKVQRFKIN